MPAALPLTIYALQTTNELSECLGEGDTQRQDVSFADGAMVCWSQNPEVEPAWSARIRSIAQTLSPLLSKSARATLLVRVDTKVFAVVFGPGAQFLIRQDRIERQWGRRIALNLVYNEKGTLLPSSQVLRRATTATLGIGLTKDSVSSRGETIHGLGFSGARELLKRVCVKGDVPGCGPLFTGSDGIGISFKLEFAQLPEVLKVLNNYSCKTDYKQHFSFVDDIQLVTNPAERSAVWNAIADALGSATTCTDIRLSPPADLELAHSEFEVLGISGQKSPLDIGAASVENYVNTVGKLDDIDLRQNLKQQRIRPLDEADAHAYILYHWLDGTVSANGKTYAVEGGDVYEVSTGYISALDRFINRVSTKSESELKLPRFVDAAERSTVLKGKKTMVRDEQAYNLHIAAQGSKRLFLDTKTVSTQRRTDKLEICDVLIAPGTFLHVKRGTGSSSISHLTAQAVNSAELLVTHQDFRAGARTVIEKASSGNPHQSTFLKAVPITPFPAHERKVIFVVIGKWRAPSQGGKSDPKKGKKSKRAAPPKKRLPVSKIPLFAKIALRGAVERLRTFGFTVEFVRVDEE